MASHLNGFTFVAVAMVAATVALLPGSAAQTTAPPPEHPKGTVTCTVGDAMGWTIPTGRAAAYQGWASSNIFEVGDILVFNFNNGAQDVAEVTKTAFDSCNGANPLSISTVPPARITITTAGQHFFICTIPGHCSSGQKVAINVTTSSPSGTPPPNPSATPLPSSSAAPPPKAVTPSPSASTPTSSISTPTLSPSTSTPSPSTSTPSSSTISPPTGAMTLAPSTASAPPKVATPLPSATMLPSSKAAPPSSILAPSAVATSPTGVAAPPAQGNSAASVGVVGVFVVILTTTVALSTFP